MRIGISMIVMADLLIRLGDLQAHYTDAGVWPIKFAEGFGWKHGYWSLHTLNSSAYWQIFLILVQLVFAVFMLLGYFTRWSTLLVWLLYISLHNRNIFVLQAGDDLLRLAIFWGLFMPWHVCYSIDQKRKPGPVKQNVGVNLGYLLLIASVYFFSVNLKTSNEWRSDGTAVYYALSLEQLRLPMGDLIYHYPSLLKMFTWLVFTIELAIPLLVLWPDKRGFLRWIAFLLIMILHLGIGMTLYVGLFYLIGITTALGLVPGFILDKIEKKPGRKKIGFYQDTVHNSSANSLNNGIALIVAALCLIINLGSLNWFGYQLRVEIETGTNALRLDQYWGVFSPGVLKKDGWFVYHGMDSLGREWDLRLDKEKVDYEKPERVVSMYENDRWRKLAENLQNDKFSFLRPLYCKYILHTWNKEHPEKKMQVLNFYFMERRSLPDYESAPPIKQLYCMCDEI
jgi:hypothetical protein